MKKILILFILMVSNLSLAQNLQEERIWKIVGRKKSVYLGSGVFHLNQGASSNEILSLRRSYNPSQGFERLVIDFSRPLPAKIYGYISAHNKKIMIDFFDTALPNKIEAIKNSQYVESVDFMSIDPSQVTMEINLKAKANFDIFYLEQPGRLVIDIRK